MCAFPINRGAEGLGMAESNGQCLVHTVCVCVFVLDQGAVRFYPRLFLLQPLHVRLGEFSEVPAVWGGKESSLPDAAIHL